MLTLFISIGFLILAWRFAPAEGVKEIDWWIFSGVFGVMGAMGILKFFASTPGRPVHWLGRAPAKAVIVLAAWCTIIWAALTYGTPHLSWWQHVDARTGERMCVYLGWQGVVSTPRPCTHWRFL